MESTPIQKEFKRSFGLLDATMVVAGSMIGSGIFIVSADMTRTVGSAGWLVSHRQSPAGQVRANRP